MYREYMDLTKDEYRKEITMEDLKIYILTKTNENIFTNTWLNYITIYELKRTQKY